MHDKQVRRRRVLLAALVAVSLILLTAYFGESPTSPLHSVQRGIVEIVSPIQEGASKVLKPVSNIAGWFSDTLRAKSQVDKLRSQVYQLEAKLAQYQSAALLNQQLSKEVGLDRSLSLGAYARVGAQVIARDPTLWYQTVEVDKGSDDGVRQGDPVLGWGALVGVITSVSPTVSTVSLITDHSVSVTAQVTDGEGDAGVLVPAVGNPNQLVLEDLPTPNQPTTADPTPGPVPGDQVMTAGFKSGPLESLYPAGIPIGTVSSVDPAQLANNGQVDVAPIADLRRLQVVQILIRPQAVGFRAQVGSPG